MDSYAVAALVLAVLGLFVTFPLATGSIALVFGVLAMVFGVMAAVRSRRGYKGAWMVIAALLVGALVTFGGAYNSLVLARTATAAIAASQYTPATTYPTFSAPSYAAPVPYAGPTAAPAPAAPTSYTYEVTGNYVADSLSFTESNGDMGGDVEDHKLPWKKTVNPEPNGNGQYLRAGTSSTKGDAWITCTLKDDKGTVVDTDTKRGAYASCMVRSYS